ncbi:Protein turtle-like B [Holothuria leucospilota]|uniref:Protein turtle-like B n=1 Tax=Holothuria leucospilota TaxID=206669 RepID=A0A9Q1BWS3_HOLLE|nr:Protein turtle-like B [Holothuria leucospilota]
MTNVTVDDAGTYECQVIELNGNYAGVGNGTFVNLIILRPPEFLATPSSSIVFREGDRQTLQCLSDGVPVPTVTWYKQGEQLRSSRYLTVEGDTITFNDVRREDGGSYLCRAENSEGSLQDTTRVIVEGAPYIFIPPQDVVVLRNQEAVFQCEYEASPSNVSQRWYYEGAVVQELSQFANRHMYLPSGGLRIQNADIEDEGKFLCSPSNGIGIPPSAFAFLTVQCKLKDTSIKFGMTLVPTFLYIDPAFVISMPSHIYAARGEPVSIPCNSDAKPSVLRVLWRRNQREIAVSQSSRYSIAEDFSLTIHDTQYSDVGAYSCIPYNTVGTDGPSDAAVLRVIERPSLATSPQSAYHININGSVELPCTASGNPRPAVQWTKVDGILPAGRSIITSQGLTIFNLTKEDNGIYECSVSNEVATAVASAYVYVQLTTPHIPANVTVLTSTSSAYVAWDPGYNGGREQTFTVRYRPSNRRSWSKLTDIPETVSSILLYSLPPSTEYEFSVSAQNIFGNSGWTPSVSMETKADGETPTDGAGIPQPGVPPSPPTNLTLTVTGEGLLLSWKPPSDNSIPVSHYALEYWIEGPWLVLEDRVPGENTELLLIGLQVNTSYSFRLIAFSDSSFSEPSQPVEGDTWGMPVYRPTPPSQAIIDLTGILAGVVAGVVAHSDQSSDDSQRLPPSPPKGFFGKHLSNIKVKLSPQPKHSGRPNITIEPARSVQQNLRERFSKTSIGGRAGVYHVSSSEMLNATVSGRVDYTPPRQFSDGSTINGSEAMEAEELNGIRLMEATEQLDGCSDDSQWCDEKVSLQHPHVKFQLTSVRPPPKPDRGDYVYYHGCMLINSSSDAEQETLAANKPLPHPNGQKSPNEFSALTGGLNSQIPVDQQRYVDPFQLKSQSHGPVKENKELHDPRLALHACLESRVANSRESLGSRETLPCSATLNPMTSPSSSNHDITTHAHSIVYQTNDSSNVILLHPGRHIQGSVLPEEPHHWTSTSTLMTDREYTTQTFAPGPQVRGSQGYDDGPQDYNYPYGQEADPYVNEETVPFQNGVDDLPGYDQVPQEMDGMFHAQTVHYDDVPDELTYEAEELYASLRDEIPKRKFGVHEYALERSPSEETPPTKLDDANELSHEYTKLERDDYPYAVTAKCKGEIPSGIKLSNDSGLNSDHSSQESPQSEEASDPGTIEASLDSEDMTPSRQGPPVKSTPRPSNQSLPPVSISPLSISTNQESLSSADPQDASIVGPLPDFRHFNGYHRRDTLSPPDSHHSASSGYGSRNTSAGTRSSQSRDSGPFNSHDITLSNMSDRNLPNLSQSMPGSADEQTKYDPELEQELMEALKRYYESDEDFQRSKEEDEKEKKQKRCEELKKEFEEYRREQVNSGAKSPRKTTVV